MKYYLLGTDPVYTDSPKIINWFGKIIPRYLNREEAHEIPPRQLLNISENPNTVFTDIVSIPFPLISEKVKRVFDLYEPDIIYKQIILLDEKYERSGTYYLPILDAADCFMGEEKGDRYISVERRPLDYRRIGEKALFRLGGKEEYYVAGRVDLVESLLRRGMTGIGLKELNVVNDRRMHG